MNNRSKAPRWAVTLVTVGHAISCSGSGTPPLEAGAPDGYGGGVAVADTAMSMPPDAHDAASQDAVAQDLWAEVDRLIRESMKQSSLPGLGLVVRDARDQIAFSRVYGDFAFDRTIGVASASKLVSALLLLDLVAKGRLSLDATTGAVLGWPGIKAGITLRHLLSFTSGLLPEAICTAQAAMTLAACVDRIRDAELAVAAGTRFDYGSTHLHVAARMAEVVTGKTWNELFTEVLAQPLGFPSDVGYFTFPRRGLGRINPLVAGGLRLTTSQYMELLAVAFHAGTYRGLSIGSDDLFAQQTIEPFPGATIGVSPAVQAGQAYRYGLGAWLECPEPAARCQVLSSPGAFGFTPWIDRQAGYYAAIAMELDNLEGGVVKASLDLEQALQPAIKAALAAR